MSTEINTETNEMKQESSNRIEYGKIVGKVSAMMQQDGALSTGEMADLRRISPDQPFTPALWRLLLMQDLDHSPGWIRQERWERRWATLFMGMAHCAGLHNYNLSLGEALAEAGWSELRFVQLMRATDETLETHLRRVAQFLAGKNQEANWTDVARLLFYQSGEAGEKIRLSISRDYYSKIYKQEQEAK
ncbi:MAG: type I-E CRISPR-associated protein Cse2/CasB [Balneolaceae bacterium]|nr:type I-E CRISPR-associated protein Cse2/CasB [Balneolaceae bacterium]